VYLHAVRPEPEELARKEKAFLDENPEWLEQ
jgi:hypothetical protein